MQTTDRPKSSDRPKSPGRARNGGRVSKSHEAAVAIRDMAANSGPGGKLPTVFEMRSRLNVSLATLNTALDALERQNVIVRRHGSGIYVPMATPASICIICDAWIFRCATHSPFWDILLEHALKRAASRGQQVSCHFRLPGNQGQGPLYASLADDIQSGTVHGVLGVGLDQDAATWIEQNHVPYVSIAGPGIYAVEISYEPIISLGVARLAAQGCRRIALWGALPPYQMHPDGMGGADSASLDLYKLYPVGHVNADSSTLDTFRRACAESGVVCDPDLIELNRTLIPLGGGATHKSHQEQGYDTAMIQFARSKEARPDGIVILDDLMTLGALAAMQQMKIEVGREVQVVTHTNRGSGVLLGRKEPLISVQVDPEAVAEVMLDMLERVMKGVAPEQNHIVIHPTPV